jgi:hypothetical protein
MSETTNEISSYLAPNERVLWQGLGHRWGMTLAGQILSVTILAVAILILSPFSFMVLFIFVGIELITGIPIVMRRTGNAHYFVTATAAILIYPPTAWSGRRITVVPFKNLQQVTLIENSDGTGTLTFVQSLVTTYGRRYLNSWWADSIPAFWNIEQPTEVYQLIRQQMSAA